MKFLSNEDKKLFLIEIGMLNMLESVGDGWEPTPQMIELYVKKRKELIPGLRDFRRSQNSKQAWRQNRYSYLKGIKRFHKSTKGKRMHRALGTFLATRETLQHKDHAFDHAVFEGLKALSSLKTHAIIELEYFQPLDEYIEFTELVEQIIPLVSRVDSSFLNGALHIEKDDLELLYRLTNEDALIEAYANKWKVDNATFLDAWMSKKQTLQDGGMSEENNEFYTTLIADLEKKFGKH